MKKNSQFKGLLKELSRDPALKQVIAKARRQTRGKGGANAETATDIVLLILTIASHFTTKKKARALEGLKDTVSLLVQISLLLKENIFERHEVKEFFRRSSKKMYSLAQECVAMALPGTRGLHPVHPARPC